MDKMLITSYNDFSVLAHSPEGNIAKYPFHLVNTNTDVENLDLISLNPAFVLKHPDKNIIYTCCETITNGFIETYSYKTTLDGNFKMTKLGCVNSGGRSACFITIDKNKNNLIIVNYWDSNISVLPLKNHIAQEPIFIYKSKKRLVSVNLQQHLMNRQSESHNHSLIFYCVNDMEIAIVSDLGTDKIKFYEYFGNNFVLINEHLTTQGSGPRYMLLKNNILYIANELNSTVQVYEIILRNRFLRNSKKQIVPNKYFILKNKQIISTIPKTYQSQNTCGNILFDCSKDFLFVSNRGHNSIVSYKVLVNNCLEKTGTFDCGGKTPRHFSINNNYLFIANQDSNNLSVKFWNVPNVKNTKNSEITENLETIKNIKINSPNFVLLL